MNTNIIAIIVSEGGRIVSELIRNYRKPPQLPPSTIQLYSTPEPEPLPAIKEKYEPTEKEEATERIKQGTACIPCTNSHLHACVGLLNEASRFAKKDGISNEVIKRVDGCLGEIVAAERIDLTPENVDGLPPGEKEIANYAAMELREIRHSLEAVPNAAELDKIAARTARLQHHVSQRWFGEKLKGMDKEEKLKIIDRTLERLQKAKVDEGYEEEVL